MGREIYGRETSRPQASPATSQPICGTTDPMIDIPSTTSMPPSDTSGSRMYRTDSEWDISPRVQADRDRRAFLASRMPGFYRISDPAFELTEQQVFNFMDEHGRYQSIIDLIKQGIQDVIVSELFFNASSSEEFFVVMSALRDLQEFMGAVAMQKALREMTRNHPSVEGQRWSVPLVKPVAWMYPTLQHPRIKNQLEVILMWAENIGNSI